MSKYLPIEVVKLEKKKPKLTIQAHEYFDRIWKLGYMKKCEAYTWLSTRMKVEDAHMRGMNEPSCIDVIEYSIMFLNDMRRLELDISGSEPFGYIECDF